MIKQHSIKTFHLVVFYVLLLLIITIQLASLLLKADMLTMREVVIHEHVQDNYNFTMGTCYLHVNDEGYVLKSMPYKHYSEEHVKVGRSN